MAVFLLPYWSKLHLFPASGECQSPPVMPCQREQLSLSLPGIRNQSLGPLIPPPGQGRPPPPLHQRPPLHWRQ